MNKHYLLAEDTINTSDLEDLREWLSTDPWLTQGTLVEEFEERWARFIGTSYALFVNSGSSANLLMYYSLLLSGKLKNNKVIVPAVSWSTSVAPAIQLGFEPIMCEASWTDFGLDIEYLEKLIKEHDPAAVMTVPVLGVPNDMDSLMNLKERYGFILMEDTCAATGSRYNDQLLGTFGDLSTFSFYFGHHMSTIEGGMVCTSDESIYEILLQVRSHGWAKNLGTAKERAQALERQVIEFNRPFTFYYPGFNVRSTDLNARIGLSQLKKLNHAIDRRVENHLAYQTRILNSPTLHCQSNDSGLICSISFSALAESEDHRGRIANVLMSENIETRPVGGGNMSRQPFWYDRYGATKFPIADRIHTTGFQLPNHPSLTPDDIQHICDIVLAVT